MQLELSLRQRVPHCDLHLLVCLQLRMHRHVEKLVGAAAARFRTVECDISRLDQLICRGSVFWRKGNSDAGPDVCGGALDAEGLGKGIDQSLCEAESFVT